MKSTIRVTLPVVSFLSLSLIPAAHPVDLSYVDFADVTGLQLNGSAAKAGNVLRVTPALSNQSGSAFSTSPISLNNLSSFSTYFCFRISNSGGISDEDGAGADGLVFVVQTVANNVGGMGGGIGYAGIPKSLGVEFDPWNNTSNGYDHDGNHVAVDFNGDVANSAAQTHVNERLNNGDVWHAWVDYNGAAKEIEVRLAETTVRPTVPLIALNADIGSILGQPDAFVGFTSGTGSAWGDHDVLTWKFSSSYNPFGLPDSGSPLLLLGLSGAGWLIVRAAARAVGRS